MAVIQVDDPDDPRIDEYRDIPDPVLLAERRLFVAEGRLVVRRLLGSKRLATRSVMVTAPALATLADVLPAGVTTYVVPQRVMNAVTGFHIHRGCLAIGERAAPLDWRVAARDARTVVVLERVANADNVGAVFRNAAAFAADAVLLGPACADPLYRKAIRTSMAAALSVPFAPIEPWPDGLHDLRASGFQVIGMRPCAAGLTLQEAVSRAADRVALVAGHEGEGLTAGAVAACDTLARIPITTGVDSLNVATAVAIGLYELREKTGVVGETDLHGGTGKR